MEPKAERIVDIISDYENNQMTVEHVIDWVSQFDSEDQEFILDELALIFEKTYLSREACKRNILGFLEQLAIKNKYADVPSFLVDTVFLDLQEDHKSQKELLNLLTEVLEDKFSLSFADCGRSSRHFVYLDDILSTGNTICRNLHSWLKGQNSKNPNMSNFDFIKSNDCKLSVCVMCTHLWGQSNVEYRLMQDIGDEVKKYISYHWYYAIENNLKAYNAALNNMIPLNQQLPEVGAYFESLSEASMNADRAYRKANQPGAYEKLFSSSGNRNRLETIFLKKGIAILNSVQNLQVRSLRPMGYTIRSHKTFGLGTLFFTYRNIPNNCPIVFWWANNNWRPLFVLKNRGRLADKNR